MNKSKLTSLKRQLLLIVLSLPIVCFFSNFTENFSERLITSFKTFLSTNKIINSWVISVDEKGIPFVDYGNIGSLYIGEQKNPVTVCQKALEYYADYQSGDENKKELFLNCCEWILENLKFYENYAVFEYQFPLPYYNMQSPWRSAMAQGQALQVLLRAQKLTSDEKYLKFCNKILASFFIEVADGGVTYKSAESMWWYEECADENGIESKILNGMQYTLLGIHEFYLHSQAEDAKLLFTKGINALENNLDIYDKDGYSYYDVLGKKAGKFYHNIHVQLLNQLYKITDIPTFKIYHDKWKKYADQPFIMRQIKNPSKMGYAILIGNFVIFFTLLQLAIFIVKKFKQTNYLECQYFIV